jgi:hypothetical protein
MGYLAGSWEDKTERLISLKAAKLKLRKPKPPAPDRFWDEEEEDDNNHPF